MKKVLTMALTIVLLAVMFAGCKSSDTTSETTDTSSEALTSEMKDEEIRSLYLTLYRERMEEVNAANKAAEEAAKKAAKEAGEDESTADWEEEPFISQEMQESFSDLGFDAFDSQIQIFDELYRELKVYYNPILIPDSNDVMYVDEHGDLRVIESENLTRTIGLEGSSIHLPNGYEDGKDTIKVSCSGCIIRNNDALETWEFGEKLASIKLPENAVYTGDSYWVGLIFRAGSDVYAVKCLEGSNNIDMEPIAHGVKQVIVADYKLNSDAWSQPLFQMQDGSVKAYCDWAGDREAPADDESHLVAPEYEGGYK